MNSLLKQTIFKNPELRLTGFDAMANPRPIYSGLYD
jgi:hypothetical protein